MASSDALLLHPNFPPIKARKSSTLRASISLHSSSLYSTIMSTNDISSHIKGAQVDRASETASKMDDTKGTTPTPTAAEEPQVWLRNLSFLVTPPLTLISAGPAVCTNLDMMITIVGGVLLFLLPWSIGKGISGLLPA